MVIDKQAPQRHWMMLAGMGRCRIAASRNPRRGRPRDTASPIPTLVAPPEFVLDAQAQPDAALAPRNTCSGLIGLRSTRQPIVSWH